MPPRVPDTDATRRAPCRPRRRRTFAPRAHRRTCALDAIVRPDGPGGGPRPDPASTRAPAVAHPATASTLAAVNAPTHDRRRRPARLLSHRARLLSHGARLLSHGRTGMAVKAGLAATLAWVVATRLPDPLGDYAYYAPLGAVVVIYPTVAGTVRESLQAVTAISLGAGLAVATDAVLGPGALAVAVVVTVGVLVGGLPWLGAQRSYVPIAGMFVLVLGQGVEVDYGASYALLFLLGAAIAVLANVLLPQLLVTPVDVALDRLRTELVRHLDHLADAVGGGTGERLQRSGLTDLTSRARDVVLEAREGERGNLRARRHPTAILVRYEAFRALERVVLLVDDVHDLVDDRPWGADTSVAPEELREALGHALSELAVAVDDVGVREPDPEQRARASAAVDDLVTTLRAAERTGIPPGLSMVASTLATSLRRCLAVITPPDMLDADRARGRAGTEGSAATRGSDDI